MKNKIAEQIANKKRHKEELMAKRQKSPSLERRQATLEEKPFILIVCEGENTEPSYFSKFKLVTAKIKAIGEGYNTISLVERAIDLRDRGHYDQTWCVFDADPKPDNSKQAANFNEAIILAKKNGIRVAYSNQAFEYWMILHFQDHQGGSMSRRDYNDVINKLIKKYGVAYDGEGSKEISDDLFDLMDSLDENGYNRRELAITRAERIFKNCDQINPAKAESSTTVFELVAELQKHI